LSLLLRSHRSLLIWAITHGSQSQSLVSPSPTSLLQIVSKNSRNSMLTSSLTSKWLWSDMPSTMMPRPWPSLTSKLVSRTWVGQAGMTFSVQGRAEWS
ncbi:hypothetical protein BGZ93_004538, partial [Podila epicladia]